MFVCYVVLFPLPAGLVHTVTTSLVRSWPLTARNRIAGREHIVVKGPADHLDRAGKFSMRVDVFIVHDTNPGSRFLPNIRNVQDPQATAGDVILFPLSGYSYRVAPRYGASLSRWTTIIFYVHYRWILPNHVADAGDVLWSFPSCLLLKRLSSFTGMAVQAESVAFLESVTLASLP